MSETWTTRTISVDTRGGTRYQGVCYVGEGRPTFGLLPQGAQVRYRTGLHKTPNTASEQARGRTIHHNLWHDGSGWTDDRPERDDLRQLHDNSPCPERA